MPNDGGDYKINVMFADQHIPGSPFTAVITDEFDQSKVCFRLFFNIIRFL